MGIGADFEGEWREYGVGEHLGDVVEIDETLVRYGFAQYVYRKPSCGMLVSVNETRSKLVLELYRLLQNP